MPYNWYSREWTYEPSTYAIKWPDAFLKLLSKNVMTNVSGNQSLVINTHNLLFSFCLQIVYRDVGDVRC